MRAKDDIKDEAKKIDEATSAGSPDLSAGANEELTMLRHTL